MKNKQAVTEILNVLELKDAFQRVDINKHDLERIEHLLEPFLNSSQNNSPYLSELINLCKKYNGIMECYVVNTDRADTRFSCEGIVFNKLCDVDMSYIVSNYHSADELDLTTNSDGSFRLRLWWD